MAPSSSASSLQQINVRLRSALTRLRPEQRHCSSLRAQDFSDLLKDLLRAAECLQHKPSGKSEPDVASPVTSDATSFEEEARAYHLNLEKLNRFLPDLHTRLLAEKSRLENALAHAAAASAWAQANKPTL
jgi:hypothetical protein